MVNSRNDCDRDRGRSTNLRFKPGAYVIVRIDGHNFHQLCSDHNFDKPNDKRFLDLMIHSAKALMRAYRGQILLAYGHGDEFSFLIKPSSNLLKQRVCELTSMLTAIFTASCNNNWNKFFQNSNQASVQSRKYDVWFRARPKEYPNRHSVVDYFRWRQVDCHKSNLYNTTLHCLTGQYVKHELVSFPAHQEHFVEVDLFTDGSGSDKLYTLKKTPITEWISDTSKFYSIEVATSKLPWISNDQEESRVSHDNKTPKALMHDIMFRDYGVNYNRELEQFKKGTVILDTEKDRGDSDNNSLRQLNVDLSAKSSFWDQNKYIFDDNGT